MPLLVAILLGLAILALVVYPLVDPAPNRRGRGLTDVSGALDAEAGAKQALRDLDFDHRLGNLEDADYADLRERYEERALDAMKARYDRDRALDAMIESELAGVRAQLPATGKSSFEAPAKSANLHPSPKSETPAKTARSATPSHTEKSAKSASPASPLPERTPDEKPGLRRRRVV